MFIIKGQKLMKINKKTFFLFFIPLIYIALFAMAMDKSKTKANLAQPKKSLLYEEASKGNRIGAKFFLQSGHSLNKALDQAALFNDEQAKTMLDDLFCEVLAERVKKRFKKT
jgi:hypothetical protein